MAWCTSEYRETMADDFFRYRQPVEFITANDPMEKAHSLEIIICYGGVILDICCGTFLMIIFLI